VMLQIVFRETKVEVVVTLPRMGCMGTLHYGIKAISKCFEVAWPCLGGWGCYNYIKNIFFHEKDMLLTETLGDS
jgi:hypothetical protein